MLWSFTHCSHFHFSFFFFLFLLCCVFALCCLFLIFRADTRLFLFNLIVENLLSRMFFFIIMVIIRCSGILRDVPECSMFRVLSTSLFYNNSSRYRNELARTHYNAIPWELRIGTDQSPMYIHSQYWKAHASITRYIINLFNLIDYRTF